MKKAAQVLRIFLIGLSLGLGGWFILSLGGNNEVANQIQTQQTLVSEIIGE